MTTKKVSILKAWLLGLLLLGSVAVRAQTTPLSDLDALRYIASHPDLIAAFGADAAKGRSHYETWGIKEGRKITFEPLNYTASHPDLIAAFGIDEIKAATHYIQWGFKEGRIITFDPARYMASHPDLIQAFAGDETKGATHYIQWGYKEKRQITFSDLDALQYVASFADLIQSIGSDVITAIRHYVTSGYNAGRRITFDALAYIASHGDLITAFGTDALAGVKHYINWGFREGRQVVFDALGYLSRHTDLQQAFGSDTVAATKHYITWGFREGRPIAAYAVSSKANGAGTVSPASVMVDRAGVVSFSVQPMEGYEVTAAAGCGGVLSGNRYITAAIGAPCTVEISFQKIPVFSSTIALLPDLSRHYLTLCANRSEGSADLKRDQPNMQSGATVNFSGHQDGRKDLAFTMWCGVPGGTVIGGPTPNGGVIFQQDKNGNFTDATKRISGTDLIDTAEGVAWKPVVWDFNGDGYDELIWPVQGEDGRAQQPVYRQFVFLTSQGDGRYQKELKASLRENAGSIALYQNELGSFDVATTNMFWRWTGSWQEVAGFPWYKIGTSFFLPKAGEIKATVGTRPNGPTPDRGPSIGIWRIDSFGSWSESDFFQFPARSVPWISWRKEVGTVDLFLIDGKQYVYGLFERNCEISAGNDTTTKLFVLFSAAKLDAPYEEGRTLVEGIGMTPAVVPLLFNVSNGKLSRVSATFRNWDDRISPFDLVCDDFNGDGKRDILIFPGDGRESAKPHVYLQTGDSSFAAIDRDVFPVPSTQFSSATGLYKDIDGDGIRDLVYWPLNPNRINASDTMRFPIYKGRRALSSKDLK